MIESLFCYQTSCFGMNSLKTILKIVIGPPKNLFWTPKNIFGQKGPFWEPITPKYDEIRNFVPSRSISHQFYIRFCKKQFGHSPSSRQNNSSKIMSMAIFPHFCSQDQRDIKFNSL